MIDRDVSVAKYKEAVREIACSGSTVAFSSDRLLLDSLAKTLELVPEEANTIENDVFEPFRQYENQLIKLIQEQYPLNENASTKLERLREFLNLLKKDVKSLEDQIFEEKKILDHVRKTQKAVDVASVLTLPFLGLGVLVQVIGSSMIAPRTNELKIVKKRFAWYKVGGVLKGFLRADLQPHDLDEL